MKGFTHYVGARAIAVLTIITMLLSAFPAPFLLPSAEAATSLSLELLVLPNPVGIDAEKEYVAIRNNSSQDLDLTGWKLIAANDTTLTGTTVLGAGDTFYRCRDTDSAVNGGITCDSNLPAAFNLVNGGGFVRLQAPDGVDLITVNWGNVGESDVPLSDTGTLENILGTTGGDKIDICHATGSEQNPYNAISPNLNSFFGGHDEDTDDIIPPFFYDNGNGVKYFPGNNWDAEGIAIWENDCNGGLVEAQPGTLIIKKSTSEAGEQVSFDFAGDLDAFSLLGNTEQEFTELTPGSYTVTEIGAEGWELAALSCDVDDEVVNDETNSVTVELAAGETITCEFGNRVVDTEPQPEPEPDVPTPCSVAGQVIEYTANELAVQNNGNPVPLSRRNLSALETVAPYINDDGKEGNGWSTNDFFSLGIEGFLIYEFTDKVAFDTAGPDIVIYEITGGPEAQQSDEKVTVSVSQNGVNYVEVGTFTGDAFVDISGTGLDFVKYVRLDDESAGVQGGNGDGYDVDAIAILDDSCGDEPEDVVTIVATKLVCTDETDIPNQSDWNSLRPIDADTAADWILDHPSCALTADWEFQWGPQNAFDPGDAFIGEAGEPWTTFGPTDVNGVVSTQLSASDLGNSGHLWFREVLQDGYLGFTHGENGNKNTDNVTAAVFCHTDVKNYDNYDRIDGVTAGDTYHCVAWNYELPDPVVCEPGVNLLENASFEAPVVTNNANWDIFEEGTTGLAWLIDWINPAGAPANGWIELHRGVNGWLSSDGEQHAELDADWQGPGGANGEAASIKISQMVPTVPGAEYFLSWDFSARPQTGASDNVLEVLVDGAVEATNVVANNTNQTAWQSDSVTFTGTGAMMEVAFRDAGTANSQGTLLDNVSLTCRPEPEPEDAKIKVFKWVKGQPLNEVDFTDFSFQIDDMDPIGFNEWGFGYDYVPVGETYTITEANIPADYTHFKTMCYTYGSYWKDKNPEVEQLAVVNEAPEMPEAFDGYLYDENWPPGWEWGNTVTLEDEDDFGVCLIINIYEPEVAQCEIVSDTGTLVVEQNDYAVATYDGNTAWTADIPGATWIWGDEFVQTPSEDETYTFRETFTVTDPEAANLDIAADNGYRVTINGVEVEDRLGEETNFTFFSQKSFDVLSYLQNGENVMEVEVINFGINANALQNPAGTLYKLTIDSDVACERTTTPEPDDEEENNGDGETEDEEEESEDAGTTDDDEDTEGDGDTNPNPNPNDDSSDDSEDESVSSRSGGGGGSLLGRRYGNRPAPRVAGETISTPLQCGPLLRTYMRGGLPTNDEWEVKKLQLFLLGQGYRVSVSGEFDEATDVAVRAFQSQYRDEVLTPWFEAGLVPHNDPTGWVYMTTRWKINNIVCPGSEAWPNITAG